MAQGWNRWLRILAGRRYNESVDIYSLGILLNEMDNLEQPFTDVG